MKILMIGPFPPVINGVTVSNDFLYKSLLNQGDKVRVINTETGKIASMQGDKISLLKIFTFLSIYKNIFRVVGKDVVYMTIGQTFWGLAKYSPFILFCKLLGISYVLHVHGGYVCHAYNKMPIYKKKIFRKLMDGSQHVIALSTSLAEEIKNVFTNAHVEVVENFYDPRLIELPETRTSHTVPRFLFLSNLMLGKGILEFLDALYILKHQHHVNFEVAVAGSIEKGIDNLLHAKIEAIKSHVHFFGVADFEKKKELLYWSDIFVLPTWYIMEGQPLSIIEAYVTGNVVVSTHQGGIKDISGYDSFVKVEPQNPQALAATLLEAIDKRLLMDQHIEATKKATQLRFNSTQFVEKIYKVLLRK